MASDNVTQVGFRIDALNRGDLDASLEGLSTDIEWVIAREHPAARTIHGLEELRAYYDDWLETLEDVRFDIDEIVDRADHVIAVGCIRGTGAGSGAEVVVPIAFANHFREGITIRVEEFLDPREALDSE